MGEAPPRGPLGLARRLASRLRAARSSHPFVRDSYVESFAGIDPSARISRSSVSGQVQVGRRVVLDDCLVRGDKPIEIGDYSSLSGPIRLIADLNPIRIGKFCSFAPDVSVWEANHHLGRLSTYFVMSELFGEPSDRDQLSKGPVEIGSDVWIGTRSLVLSGVNIGDGAVVAAGSIVLDDIPPYAIALGAPAKVVRYRFPEEIRARLVALRWWDWDEARIQANRFLFEADLTSEMLDRIT